VISRLFTCVLSALHPSLTRQLHSPLPRVRMTRVRGRKGQSAALKLLREFANASHRQVRVFALRPNSQWDKALPRGIPFHFPRPLPVPFSFVFSSVNDPTNRLSESKKSRSAIYGMMFCEAPVTWVESSLSLRAATGWWIRCLLV
jgi:hypothetical protein